ncbi:hypothetical protein TNIN_245211 [Trichonephila inaurata madagascariensis]|uniref:Uncharacterized protein n=1 Tax=Trichonephila inaurata madagascariensis TaxID=2747483 RepID=A0A8X6X384_9ARAC|nr:hypothetical protein TNIN_245211 [Trichonephila inaurata madagascariensis]
MLEKGICYTFFYSGTLSALKDSKIAYFTHQSDFELLKAVSLLLFLFQVSLCSNLFERYSETRERGFDPLKKNGGFKGERCPPEEKKVGKITNELSLVNVGGIFLVLLAGTGSACVLVVIEFITKSRHRRVSFLHSLYKII